MNTWGNPWGMKSDYIQIPRIIGSQKHHSIPKSTKHPPIDRLSRLDEIEALDADDIIKRMHVNDLTENARDDLRNN